MSLTHKVAYNTVFQIAGKIVTTGVSLVLIGALTRYLGVAGFGDYTTIFAYVAFAAVLADFGFFWIMIREISKDESKIEKIVNNTMTLRGLLSVVVFSIAFLVSLLIPQYSWTVRWGILVIGFAWLWTTVNSTYVGVFQSKLEMYKATITEVIGRVIIFILVMIFIKFEYSLVVILGAYAVGNLINFIASVILGRNHVHFRLAWDFDFWHKMFWEALPMGIVLVLGLVYFKIDTVMLSLIKGNVDVGIYGAPYKILEVLQILPAIFMGNIFPILTRYITSNDQRVSLTIQKAFDFLVILATPVIVGTIFLAKPIINLVAGEEFIKASTVGTFFGQPATAVFILQILIFAVGIAFISIMFNNTVIALGKQRDLVWPYIILVFVNIGLNLILIPKYSYMGAAVSTVITEILVLALTSKIVYRYLKVKLNLLILAKTFLASAVMGLVLFFLAGGNLFLLIGLAIIVYFTILYLSGGITSDIVKSMFKKGKI